MVFLSLDVFVQGFLQAGRQIFFQIGAVLGLPIMVRSSSMGMSSAAESLPSVPALHLVSAVLPEQMSASVAQGIPLRLES